MRKYCSECGTKLKDEDLFCSECGSKTFYDEQIKNNLSTKGLFKAENKIISTSQNPTKNEGNFKEEIKKQPEKLSRKSAKISEKLGSKSPNRIIFYLIGGLIVILILVLSAYFIFQDNEIKEANKLLAENKSEEAINILSKVKKDDKLYSEAQNLLKYAKSKIAYNKALESSDKSDFSTALKYFNQVDMVDSFPALSSEMEKAKLGAELIKNLPGTYQGQTTPNLGGAYMIISTKMKILNNLTYSIQEQMTDTYAGGFYNDLYSGELRPEITKFNSGEFGLTLNLKSFGKPYRSNDFSVYFYRYKNYWRLQFNLEFTWGSSTQEYTINLFREANQEEIPGYQINQNSSKSFSNEETLNFIKSFLQNANTKNIDFLLNCYSDEVDYFGKGIVDKNFIRKDKDNYFKNWDNVKYRLEDNSLSINELPDNSKIAVFNIEYSVYSSERNKQLTGIAQSTIRIRQGKNGLEIYDEKQKIISKK